MSDLLQDELLVFSVAGAFRTKGAAVAQDFMGSKSGREKVEESHAAMRQAFAQEGERGAALRQWLDAGKRLTLDAEFWLFDARFRQTDLDNLLTELYDQMLFGMFPELTNYQRSWKDGNIHEAQVRKIEASTEADERSVIKFRPLT